MRRTSIARSSRLIAAAIAAACITLALPAQAQSVAEFYSKNPVQLLIGFPAGNAYDTYGRAVARHLGRHIPGNPNVVVVNRPGAGSLTSANLLYNGAPKNGSTIATFNRSIPLDPLMGNATARFDPRKFYWLGSVGNEVSICISWHTSAVKTFNDLISKDFVLGATSFSADTGIYPLVLRNMFDAKLKIITGYPGGRRDQPGDGKRGVARSLRLVLERGQEPEARLAQGQADHRAGPDGVAEGRRPA